MLPRLSDLERAHLDDRPGLLAPRTISAGPVRLAHALASWALVDRSGPLLIRGRLIEVVGSGAAEARPSPVTPQSRRGSPHRLAVRSHLRASAWVQRVPRRRERLILGPAGDRLDRGWSHGGPD